jgi:RNA polymerase sigma factor (sigma-70 family)
VKDPELGAFIKTERQRFIAFVRALLRDASEIDPEDVLHDVLVRLLGKPSLELPLDRMTAYIYRSLRNRVVDHMRTRARHVSLDEDSDENGDWSHLTLIDLLHDVNPDALEILQSEEGKRALFEALDGLSAIERAVVIGHELEGSSFKELASRLRMPLNTLLSHKARAMKKLEKHFHALGEPL